MTSSSLSHSAAAATTVAARIKVLVSDPVSPEGLHELSGNEHFELTIKTGLNPENLIHELNGCQALIVRSETKVTSDIIAQSPALKLIGRAGVGVDNIDLDAATRRGIVVMNVPGGNTIAAAEHTIAMILALARNIPQANASMKSGKWERKNFTGTELTGKILGLVGLGRIGKEVSKRMLSFGMQVLAYDPFVSIDFAKSLGIELCDLERIYKEADFISFHVPLNDQTRHLINRSAISKLKSGVRLINCARGGIIDETALAEAINSGHIKGAALDVLEKEPPDNSSPLFKLPNVICTPHLGASTEEAQVKVAEEIAQAVIEFFAHGNLRNAVNVPGLDSDVIARLGAYFPLAEKLGRFLAQVSDSGVSELDTQISGAELFSVFADEHNKGRVVSALALSALKGLLSPALGEEINYVNAPVLAEGRGIRHKETVFSSSEGFSSLITLKGKCNGSEHSVAGTVLAHGRPRIVQIDELSVDVIPEGGMLVLTNQDKPGIVGFVGTVLGKNNINIAGLQVGRKTPGEVAVSIFSVDSKIPAKVLEEIKSFPGIVRAKWVEL